jgi:hypothetical protein
MSTNDDHRIRDLAGHAWALSNSDPVRAIEILRGWKPGVSFDAAFAALDAVLPAEVGDPIAQALKNSEEL